MIMFIIISKFPELQSANDSYMKIPLILSINSGIAMLYEHAHYSEYKLRIIMLNEHVHHSQYKLRVTTLYEHVHHSEYN